jgi:hypothetical protein
VAPIRWHSLCRRVKPLTAIEIALRLGGAGRDEQGSLRCRCPAHPPDDPPTLHLANTPAGVALWCTTGCDVQIIFAELRWRGLTPPIDRDDEYRPVPPRRGAP